MIAGDWYGEGAVPPIIAFSGNALLEWYGGGAVPPMIAFSGKEG